MKNKIKDDIAFFIYGIQPAQEVLLSKHEIENIILAKELDSKIKNKIINLTQNRNLNIKYIPKQQFQRFTGAVLHQGVAVELKKYRYISEDFLFKTFQSKDNLILLILDQIQDPHNFGAIIRTAEICGVDAIIIPEKGSAKVNPTVAKTSAGAVFHLPIHQTNDLFILIDKLKDFDIQIAATVAGQQNNIYQIQFPEKNAIIIGSEGKGVRKNLLKLADTKISIPQFGKVNSLNASVSSAVILYEIVRQKNYT